MPDDWFRKNAPPGGEDWFAQNKPTAGAGQTPQSNEAPMGRFREEAWKKIDPVSAYQSMVAATTQPVQAIRAMGQAQGTLLEQSIDAFKQGQYARALRKGIHGMLPVFGPEMDEAAEQFERGDIGGGLGASAGTLFSLVHPEAFRGRQYIPVVPKVNSLNPLEQRAMDFAVSQDVPVSSGTATGNRFLRGMEYGTANTPLGSLVAARSAGRVEPALQRVAGELTEKALPGRPMSPEGAGTEVRSTLQAKVDDYTTRADKQYGPWRRSEADPRSLRSVQQGVDDKGNPIMEDVPMPVDVRDLKALVAPLEAKLARAWEPSKQYASRGLKAMRSILESKNFISSSDAELDLSGLKRMSREDPEGIAGGDVARLLIPELQKRIDDAVKAVNPRAATQLRRGRVLTRRAHEVRDVLDDLLEEPVQAYGQMTWRQDAGIERLRSIEKEAPGSLHTVGRAFLESLFGEAMQGGGFSRTQGILNKWNNLGPETKKLLFPNPLLRQNVGDFLLAAQKYGQSPNPSGTAGVLTSTGSITGGGMFIDPLTTVLANLGAGGLAKALYSPRTAKLLTKGVRIPIAGSGAANALWLTNLIKEAGEDVQERDKIIRYNPDKP